MALTSNHSKMVLPSHSLHDPQLAAIPSPYPDSGNGSGSSDARSSLNSDTNAMSILTDSDAEQNHHWSNNGSPTIGPAAFATSDRYPWHRQFGRIYQGFRRKAYFLPCDEREQDRLDIFHKVITEARHGDGLLYSPHPPNARILDLGCGTGIWALDVSNKYPNAHVVGVDLAPIQPLNGPKNCDFFPSFDFEGLWEMGEETWDVVHLQMGCGSVAGWESLFRRVFNHLRPGAWFEQVEIDFEPRCDDTPIEPTALHAWYTYLKEATQQTMRPIAHSSGDIIEALQKVGFTDIDHQVVGLPLNPWHRDEQEKKVARWYNLAFCESIEPFTLFPFCNAWHASPDYIQKTTDAVKREAYNSDLHVYNLLHMYRARKPIAAPGSVGSAESSHGGA